VVGIGLTTGLKESEAGPSAHVSLETTSHIISSPAAGV
jgi:hypothetical protein